MRPSKGSLRRLLREIRGISAVEYALLLALIGLVVATSALALGNGVTDRISQTEELLED